MLFRRFLLPGLFLLPLYIALAEGKDKSNEENQIGFYGGKFFLSASESWLLFSSGSALESVEENNRVALPFWSDPYHGGVFLYSQSDYNKPRISSPEAYRIQASYGITDHFGIYSALDLRGYIAHGYSTLNYPFNVLTLARKYTFPDVRTIELTADTLNQNYILTKDKNGIFVLLSGELGLEYHIQRANRFDFYLQAGIGQGKEIIEKSRLDKIFLSAGVNLFANKYFYLKTSINHSIFRIRRTNDGYLISKSPHQGILQDTRFELGPGFSFSHLPSFPKINLFGLSNQDIRDYNTIYRQLRNNPDVELRMRDKNLTVIFLQDAIFPTGSIELLKKGQSSVERIGRILALSKNIQFTVEGHTDSVPVKEGSRLYDNQTLSEMRAVNVMQILEKMGVASDRLSYRGYGDRMPRASNRSVEGRRINRRIEILLDGDVSELEELKGLPPW